MFFIIGVQRSGTTLLRLLLNAHSQIAVAGESEFLMPLLNRGVLRRGISGNRLAAFIDYLKAYSLDSSWMFDASPVYEELSRHTSLSLRELISTLHSGFANQNGKRIWGDKTPSFFRKVDILADVFPEAKFIHIVRDGRDSFHSWRKLKSWRNNVAVIALEWRYKVHRVEKSFSSARPDSTTTVRYEDLLSDPEHTIAGLCEFLGVAYEPSMLDFHTSSDKFITKNHSKLIFAPLNRENTFKWQRTISAYELAVFNRLAGDTLGKYGYSVEKLPIPLSKWPRLVGDLVYGLPSRALQILIVKRALSTASKSGTKPIDIHKI